MSIDKPIQASALCVACQVLHFLDLALTPLYLSCIVILFTKFSHFSLENILHHDNCRIKCIYKIIKDVYPDSPPQEEQEELLYAFMQFNITHTGNKTK